MASPAVPLPVAKRDTGGTTPPLGLHTKDRRGSATVTQRLLQGAKTTPAQREWRHLNKAPFPSPRSQHERDRTQWHPPLTLHGLEGRGWTGSPVTSTGTASRQRGQGRGQAPTKAKWAGRALTAGSEGPWVALPIPVQ